MPMAQKLLFYIPTPVFITFVIICITFLSVAGLKSIRLRYPHHKLKSHNDVAGAIFATAGVLYAVLIGFVAVMVWGDFERAKMNAEEEANYSMNLYRNAGGMSGDFKEKLKPLFQDYIKTVMDDEWKSMEKGMESQKTEMLILKIRALYESYLPRNETEKVFFEESVRNLNNMCDMRRIRLIASRSGIHQVLWVILISGGLVTMAFAFFFGSENHMAQVLMTSLLAILISLILLVIFLFDFPFTGDVKISPAAFEQVLAHAKNT
jgi:hypothetical protein